MTAPVGPAGRGQHRRRRRRSEQWPQRPRHDDLAVLPWLTTSRQASPKERAAGALPSISPGRIRAAWAGRGRLGHQRRGGHGRAAAVPGTSDRPVSSRSTASSKRPKPSPPNSSGRWIPSQPWAAISFHTGWRLLHLRVQERPRDARWAVGLQPPPTVRRCSGARRRLRSASGPSSLFSYRPRAWGSSRPRAGPVHHGDRLGRAPLDRHPDPFLGVTGRIDDDRLALVVQVEGARGPEYAVPRAHAPVTVDHIRMIISVLPPAWASRSRRLRTFPFWSRGSSSTTSHSRGTLYRASRDADVLGQHLGVDLRAQLHHGLQPLPVTLVGDPEHRAVDHGRMLEEHLLDLPGGDVDAAPEDHVRHPVGDGQVPVLVEVADVAHGEGVVVPRPARWPRRRCGS